MKKVQTHLKYGGFGGLGVVIVGLILYIGNMYTNQGLSLLIYLPFLIAILMNAVAYSKANDHYVTFGGVFSSGFKASALVTLIYLAWSFIALAIFPEMKEKSMEIAEESMSGRGMSDEQIEQGLEMTKKYFSVFMIGGILFGMMFWGAIFSLLGGAIAKKKKEGMPQA
jgi:uncharacterized membrane protein YciS (DUF1049 family)